MIEVEGLWASFVVGLNLAFNASDHATKLFPKMFPDSEVAKNLLVEPPLLFHMK